jgi:hypothetical protein
VNINGFHAIVALSLTLVVASSEAPEKGERDPVRLRDAGLAWLGTEGEMNNAASVGDP